MARPKKVNVDIMGDDVTEVKEYNYDDTPTVTTEEQKTEEPKMTDAVFIEDKVTPLTQQIVRPKAQEPKQELPTPICDIDVLSDSDK